MHIYKYDLLPLCSYKRDNIICYCYYYYYHHHSLRSIQKSPKNYKSKTNKHTTHKTQIPSFPPGPNPFTPSSFPSMIQVIKSSGKHYSKTHTQHSPTHDALIHLMLYNNYYYNPITPIKTRFPPPSAPTFRANCSLPLLNQTARHGDIEYSDIILLIHGSYVCT